MAVTVLGYLILISKDFLKFFVLFFLFSFSFDGDDESNTQDSV